MPGGRPTDYNADIATTICARLAEGEPLTRMCKEDGMPNVVTVYRWMRAHPEFSQEYARAREDQADTLASEILEIADDGARDYTVDDDGREIVDHDHIQRSKLRVDTRKWVACKMMPRRYGESTSLKVGGDPDNQTPITVSTALPIDDIKARAIASAETGNDGSKT